MTGQRAAQRKNSPRQWGRPFGRAPREICPAISTHPHLGRGLHHHVEVAGRWCRTGVVGVGAEQTLVQNNTRGRQRFRLLGHI